MRIVLLLLLVSVELLSQDMDPHLDVFSPLIGKTWVAQGTWGNGTEFKQEIAFKSDLNGKIIHTLSHGFIDPDQTKLGKRNHGIRKWDPESKKIRFWEFDVFGGLTEGVVTLKDRDIFHTYLYEGAEITDAWLWKDERTYSLIVGEYKEGEWTQKYLETEFRALPLFTGPREDLDALLEGMASFSKTYMAGDHIAISEFYTPDGKIMPNGPRIIKGKEAIAKRWELPEGSKVLYHKIFPEEIHINDNTAYDYGYYEGRSQAAGKDPASWKGKYVIIWKKIDGRWLMDIDIWNRVDE